MVSSIRLRLGGSFVTSGIIYTAPGKSLVYVISTVVGNKIIDSGLIIGAMSLVTQTLIFQTNVKYAGFLLIAAKVFGQSSIPV
jgi:hypothetical protein